MNVNSVASVLAVRESWGDMKEFTLEKSLMNVNIVASVLVYYASRNNDQVFEAPFQITTDLPHVREALQNLDVLEWVRQRRTNSKWVVTSEPVRPK